MKNKETETGILETYSSIISVLKNFPGMRICDVFEATPKQELEDEKKYLQDLFGDIVVIESDERNEIERIDIKEFREKGYLQEVNRRFFHPLGLALEIIIKDDKIERLGLPQ